MRNLKRVLSLVMMVAMLCSMLAIGAFAAYEDFTDEADIDHKVAVKTLVELGVIAGKEDGSFYDPDGTLTRAEAAKLVCVVLNGGKDPVLGDPSQVSYNDTQGTWASKYIEYCTSLNIVAGDGQGAFKPNDTVTATQLAKMLLVALGYDADFEKLVGGTWDTKTDAIANQIGLYEGVEDIITSEPVSRDDAAQIIYNALQAFVVYYDSDGTGVGTTARESTSTLLNKYFGVVTVEAIAVGNDVFNVKSPVKAQSGKSVYDVVTKDGANYTESNVTLPIDIDNDVVGQKVILYVKNYGKTTASVVGNVILSEENTVATTSSKMKDADKVTSFLKGYDLSLGDTAVYVKDGLRQGTATAASVINANAGIQNTFIDNNDDGVVDYVLQTVYTLSKVTVYSTANEELTISGTDAIDFDDAIGYEDVAKGDYVLYVKYGPTYYYVELADTISGSPVGYSSGDKTLTIDGGTYAQSALSVSASTSLTAYAAANTYVGNSYTFYLDQDGNIIATGDAEEGAKDYAMVLASNFSEGSLGGYSGVVKLLLADGSEVTYNVNLLDSANKHIAAYEKSLYYTTDGTTVVPVTRSGNTGTTAIKEKAMAMRLGGGIYANEATADDDGPYALLGDIVTYVINDDGTVTLTCTTARADKDNVESGAGIVKNTGATTTPPTDYNEYAIKTNASYVTVGGQTVYVNNSTVFFFYDSDKDTTNVVTGLNNLPATSSSVAQQVAYTTTNGNSVANAVYVSGTTSTSAEYVYVNSGYTYSEEGGKSVYSYKVVFTNGDTATVKSEDDSALEGFVYELTYNGVYAEFDDTSAKIFNEQVTTYAASGSLAFADPVGQTNAQNLSVLSNVNVIDVTTSTPDVGSADDLSDNLWVAVITNDDGAVETVFILDTTLGFFKLTHAGVITTPASGTMIAEGTEVEVAATDDNYTYTYGSKSGTFDVTSGKGTFDMPGADTVITVTP